MPQDKLNGVQQLVADNLDENILLVASAGTGKTNTLAIRIANILSKHRCAPEEILCLTFTNKACKEMRDRVATRIPGDGSKVVIRTFHSFCLDVIKTEAKAHTDLFSDFIVFDEEDCKELIKDIGIKFPPAMVQSLINYVKEHRAAMEIYSGDEAADYHEAIIRLMKASGSYQAMYNMCRASWNNYREDLLQAFEDHGEKIILDYNKALHAMHGLDFSDLIANASELFRHEDIQARWASRYKYINIDEVQDTSEIEYNIISRLFADNNLLLCGDYFQTIYAWRGSNPAIIRSKYVKEYAPHEYVFYENYRATRLLLNASYELLDNQFHDRVQSLYPQDIKAVSAEHGAPIKLKKAQNDWEEAQWIYSQIQQLQVQDLSRVCILTRTNYYNQKLSQLFSKIPGCNQQGGLQFMLVDEFSFFRRQEVKDVMAFLKLIINKHDVASFTRILKRVGAGIGEKTIDTIRSEEYRKVGIRLTDFLDASTQTSGDPFRLLLDSLKAQNVVVFDVESTGTDTLTDEIIQIAAIRLDGQGQIVDKFMEYVKPSKSVGSSEAVHNISDAKLQAVGLNPQEAFSKFLKFAGDAVLVGHNVSYDIHILSSQMSRQGMEQFKYTAYFDTMDIFRRFYPNLKNHKLEYLGEYCHVGHKSTHDAFDDICATAEILMFAVKENIIPTTQDREAYIRKHLDKFTSLSAQLREFIEASHKLRPFELTSKIMMESGIVAYYQQRREGSRLENLRDMLRNIRDIDKNSTQSPYDALQSVIQYASLSGSMIDAAVKKNQKIPIITVHQAKGCEFDYVFMAGLNDGLFPLNNALKSNNADEEARLFYVAMTRAKKQLFLSWVLHSQNKVNNRCRYIDGIPDKYLVAAD